ncbi:MAG: hypothetical protein ACYCY1_11470 [Sulfuriferula sp.]
MNACKHPTVKISAGSKPGLIRVEGEPDAVEHWLPIVQSHKAKLKEIYAGADKLITLVLNVAEHYECPPDEIDTLLRLAAHDPDSMRACYLLMADEIKAGCAR